jgi:hypothetical protein
MNRIYNFWCDFMEIVDALSCGIYYPFGQKQKIRIRRPTNIKKA